MIIARNVNIKEEDSIWQQRTVQLQLNNGFGVESFIGENDRGKSLFLKTGNVGSFQVPTKKRNI